MMFLQALGFKGVLVITALGALAAWAGWKQYQLSSVEAERDAAIVARDEAGIARDRALAANTQNLQVIELLKSEKQAIQTSLTNLDAEKRKNQKMIGDLSAAVRSMAADPANKVELSPVLRSTIDQIQKQRAAREMMQ